MFWPFCHASATGGRRGPGDIAAVVEAMAVSGSCPEALVEGKMCDRQQRAHMRENIAAPVTYFQETPGIIPYEIAQFPVDPSQN